MVGRRSGEVQAPDALGPGAERLDVARHKDRTETQPTVLRRRGERNTPGVLNRTGAARELAGIPTVLLPSTRTLRALRVEPLFRGEYPNPPAGFSPHRA